MGQTSVRVDQHQSLIHMHVFTILQEVCENVEAAWSDDMLRTWEAASHTWGVRHMQARQHVIADGLCLIYSASFVIRSSARIQFRNGTERTATR